MNKKEALEAAQSKQAELIEQGNYCVELNYCESSECFTVCWDEDDKCDMASASMRFPYTERVVPPKGTIVEWWYSGEEEQIFLGYSLGVLKGDGLSVLSSSDGATTYRAPHWRVVGEQGDMIGMWTPDSFLPCQSCKHEYGSAEGSPCASCKTTRPTNWEEA